jgi:hypothetical protein
MPEMRRPTHQDNFQAGEGKEKVVFLGNHSDPFGHIPAEHLLEWNTIVKDLTPLRREGSAKELQESGFPGAVRTDHADESSLLNLKRDVLKDPVLVIPKRDGTSFNHRNSPKNRVQGVEGSRGQEKPIDEFDKF